MNGSWRGHQFHEVSGPKQQDQKATRLLGHGSNDNINNSDNIINDVNNINNSNNNIINNVNNISNNNNNNNVDNNDKRFLERSSAPRSL